MPTTSYNRSFATQRITTTTSPTGHTSVQSLILTGIGERFSDIKSDLVKTTPNASGWRKPTIYQRTQVIRAAKPHGLVHLRDDPGGGTTRVDYGYYPYINTNVESTISWRQFDPSQGLINRAQLEAILKAGEDKYQAGSMIIETKRALGMIGGDSINLLLGFAQLADRDWKSALRTWGWKARTRREKKKERDLGTAASDQSVNIADLSLKASFGYLPLMSDIYAMYNAWFDKFAEDGLRVRAVRDLRVDVSERWEYVSTNRTYMCRSSGYYGVKCDLHFEIDSSWLRNLDQTQLLNPMSILAEATPWLYAVNWVLPIQDWMQAIEGLHGLVFLGGSTTRYSKVMTECEVVIPPPAGFRQVSPGNPLLTHFRVNHIRGVHLTDPPFPTPFYVKNPFTSARRLVTQLSLAIQQLHRFK